MLPLSERRRRGRGLRRKIGRGDNAEWSQRKAKRDPVAIIVTANNSGFVRTYEIKYYGGERYPHLERDTIAPDLLGDILRSLTDKNAGK